MVQIHLSLKMTKITLSRNKDQLKKLWKHYWSIKRNRNQRLWYINAQRSGESKTRLLANRYESKYKTKIKIIKSLRSYYGDLTLKQFLRDYGYTGVGVTYGAFERRLDVVVFRSHFSTSIKESRELIRKGYIEVDGIVQKTNDFKVRNGSTIVSKHSDVLLKSLREMLNLNYERPEHLVYIFYDTTLFSWLLDDEDLELPIDFPLEVPLKRSSKDLKKNSKGKESNLPLFDNIKLTH